MSLFESIMAKIFHHDPASASPMPAGGPPGVASSPQGGAGAVADKAGQPASPASAAVGTSPGATRTAQASAGSTKQHDDPTQMGAPGGGAPGGGAQSVDVAKVLDGLAARSGQTLDWKHSIVDMLKLLGLDSSLGARQELAKELNYSGDMSDSATMNIWLHKQVMRKLAANGGKVPDDLKA